MRLYLDEDLSPRIAIELRRRGIDAVSAFEVGNLQLSDREQLTYAARERRCLVTRNVRHFIDLARDAIRRQEPHRGIVLRPASVRGSEVGTIVRRLLRIAARFRRGLDAYDVLYL